MSKLSDVVMFACNEGGHFSQMMALKKLFGEYDSVLITDNIHASKETTPDLKDIGAIDFAMSIARRRQRIKDAGLKTSSRMKSAKSYVSLIIECIKLWNKYHPAVIITTGSNIAVGLFIYGWLRGSKLIFIESRAKVYSKTMTGKIVERFADKIFVQWPEMGKLYPKAEYCGILV